MVQNLKYFIEKTLITFLSVITLFSCSKKSDNKEPNAITALHGRDVFQQNCSLCHMRNYEGYDNARSLVKLSKETKSSLLQKIRNIDGDRNHRNLFELINEHEVKNLVDYITKYKHMDVIY